MPLFRIPALIAIFAGSFFAQTFFAQGPGLPNLTYSGKSPMDTLSIIDSSVGAPNGHGFVSMHRGYLLVLFASDGGGGDGTGGFAFLDISNPESPKKVFSTRDSSIYTSSISPHFAGDIAESHGHTLSGDVLCMTFDSANAAGLQFWDLSNPTSPTGPRRLSELHLSTLSGGDYTSKAWWVTWQGRYAYVGGTDAGLFIVDAADPENPREVKRIPKSELGGFNIHSAVAVGNLLVLARAEESNINPGLSILDIGDPENPRLLSVSPLLDVGYSIMVNGNRVLAADDPVRVYDIADPTNPALLGIGQDVSTKGGYGMAQDNFFILGSSNHVLKMDLDQRSLSDEFVAVGKTRPPVTSADWDFAVPLGNLIFAGNDHGDGSALLVSQIAPDTTPPAVNMVSPRNDSVNQSTLSRIGLTFTDQVDKDSIDTSSIIVRPFGGNALPGTFAVQTGIVNFSPGTPLQPNRTYEIVVPAGGVKDYAGNEIETAFLSRFSTGSSITLLDLNPSGPGSLPVGVEGDFTATSLGSESTTYAWDFGDGSPPTQPSTNPAVFHTFSQPGNYTVQVTATDNSQVELSSFTQVVYRPASDPAPTHTSSIVYDSDYDIVWSVNPDNDSVTAIDAITTSKKWEVPVGENPRTLVAGPNGTLVVACRKDATLHVIDRANGEWIKAVQMPSGSQPFGVVYTPSQDAAYVSLEGTQTLAKLDPTELSITASLNVGPTPRGIAITGDGSRLLLTRFLSPDPQGEVIEMDLNTFTVKQTIALQIDPGPDDEDQGRGLPNYLSTIAISPDGGEAWIPSKKDNIERGLGRDGLPLTFESTVRSIVSQIDLSASPAVEITEKRHDFNDRGIASAVAFNPLGNLVYVTTQGTATVEILDAYSGILRSGFETGGRAPQGLAVNPEGTRLYVQNFMSRSVSVFEINDTCDSGCSSSSLIAQVATVAEEKLSPTVLRGKQIFYDSSDPRLNRDKYLSCAACHLDGEHDGRIWDFTDRGEGFRNTISLRGKSGSGQGRVHWSANFDEIQDFEHDIRNAFGGLGLLSDSDYHSGTHYIPLGDPKAGLSSDLDALAAYVGSLNSVPNSPYRETSGVLTSSAQAGKALFGSRCASCHGGENFSDSTLNRVHDVGTLKASSGQRLGKTLAGIDTPGLRGVWATAPYLHDGSAHTLRDVLTAHNASDLHGVTSDLTETELRNLIDYLLQLDDRDIAFPLTGDFVTDSDEDFMPDAFEEVNDLDPYLKDGDNDADSDGSPNFEEYNRGTNVQDSDTDNDGLLDGVETGTGIFVTIANTGTNPLLEDSDKDGFLDGFEVSVESDPNDSSSLPPGAGFVQLEDFQSHDLEESVTGGSRWIGSNSVRIVSDPSNTSGKVATTQGVPGEINLSADISDYPIKEGDIGTIFFRIRTSSATGDFHLGLSDDVNDLEWGDFYYQIGLKSGNIIAKDGGSEKIQAAFQTDTWYKIWMVANTLNNRYDVYIQGGAFETQTLLVGDFGQRNGGNGNLNAFRIKASIFHTGNDVVLFDDLYVAPATENLRDPTQNLSAPTVDGITLEDGSIHILVSELNPNLYYTLQRSRNLEDPWSDLLTNYQPVETEETFVDSEPPAAPVFYRILVRSAP